MTATVENRLFVCNLPAGATTEDLSTHFAQFGETVDVFIPLRYGSQMHKGVCFVEYATNESLQLAMKHTDHSINGQPVTVDVCLSKGAGKNGAKSGAKGGKSMPGTVINGERLFITKIPQDATQQEVEELFSKYGDWTDVFMPAGKFDGGHKGICFISYSDQSAAQLAISCAPHLIRGQELVVEVAAPRDAKGAGKGKAYHVPTPQYSYVVQQPAQWWSAGKPQGQVIAPPAWGQQKGSWGAPAAGGKGFAKASAGQGAVKPGRLFVTKVPHDVSKEDLTAYFQQYGPLEDVFVPTGKSIAFISFGDHGTAQLAVQQTEHEITPGRMVTVDLAYDRPPLDGKGKGKGKGKQRYQAY